MKRIVLFSFALASILSASANQPYERLTTAANGSVKQLNTRAHFARPTQTRTPQMAPEAPANAIEVPFTHQLGKNSTDVDIVKTYTTINVNDDNRKWQVATVNDYSACMAPNADNIEANDDWLITVPIHMTAGKYTVAFDLGFLGSGATGVTMEVKLGTSPTVEGMIAEIVAPTVFDTKERTTYEYNCAIPEDGYYYIGFHNLTTKSQKGATKLFSVGVTAGETVKVDPPAAGTLTYELAPKGELKATLTYVAPTKTKSGADLESISKVELTSRWTVDKYTFDNVSPGQTIVQEVPMYAGFNNRFTAVAYIGDTAGEMVEYKDIFCGPDTPLPPTDIKLIPSADYKSAVLSWTAPGEVGENDGYVDPENLIYYIFNAFGSYYDPAIATTDKTSVTIEYPDLAGQDFVAYQVTAGNGEYYSKETASEIVTIGKPAQMPFTESFSNGLYDGIWCIDPTTGFNQDYGTVDDNYFASLIDPEDPDAPEPLKSHDGDNGFYYWMPLEKDITFGIISVRTDISKAVHPVLEFWYQGQGSLLEVLIAGATGKLEVAETIDLQKAPTNAWTLARIPLDNYKEAGAVQFEIKLTAIHNDDEHIWSVPFDDISIRDLVETDMRIITANIPAKAKVGDTFAIAAHMQNLGSTASDATAECYVNGTKIGETNLGNLKSYDFADATFNYTIPMNSPENLNVKVTVVADGDACPANDAISGSLKVIFPDYPGVTELTASPSADGSSITLSWIAPTADELKEPKTIFEDFENEEYIPLSITGAGEWTVYDGDGKKTYNVFQEKFNPYQTQPIAFQLFNREIAEVTTYWDDAKAHSGNNFMLAPSAQSAQNDNWLISPELSGRAQTVSFWAKSYIITWPESFEVLYSTTGNTAECFTESVSVENYPANGIVPEVWTEFSFELPDSAKYFAIRHNTYDTLALFVDDITYEATPVVPADLALIGYHVFRDGIQLTGKPISETTYVDNLAASQSNEITTHSYSVVAVYNYGTAKGSEISVNAGTSGIETITIDTIGTDDRLYNLGGIEVDPAAATTGMYILIKNGKASKVAIK